MKRTLLLLAGLAIGAKLYAADALPPGAVLPERIDLQKECQSVKGLQPPKEDMPSKALLDSVVGCNAETIYYDAKSRTGATKADWEKVRACAILTNNNTYLMMLYANGYGVKQNLDLAIKYACVGNNMFVDPAYLVTALEDVRSASGSMSKPFDVCDYAGITPAVNRCSGIREMERHSQREQRLTEFGRQLTPAQKASFEQLSHAAGGFSSGHGDEIDEYSGAGSGRVAFVADARMEEGEHFLDDIGQAENNQFPAYTQEQFAELDRELNEVYKNIVRSGTKDANYPG
ncbi:MAG TPA: hypothetical protein VIU46_04905, partial [Gallionellaceae bacterium]